MSVMLVLSSFVTALLIAPMDYQHTGKASGRTSVFAALGRTDDAFAALEEGYQSRAEWMSYLKVDPQMDTLRREPRYTNLLKRLNL